MDDNPASTRKSLETFWTRERLQTEVNAREGFSGAGYGDRTRLTGLGSQDITTMLSPHAPDLINLRREAQARSSEKRSQALRRRAPATRAGAGGRRRTGCPGRSAPRRSSTVARASAPAR